MNNGPVGCPVAPQDMQAWRPAAALLENQNFL